MVVPLLVVVRRNTRARGIVDVPVFVLRAIVPLDEVIQQVVGERGRGAAVGAAGDVTIGVVSVGIGSGSSISTERLFLRVEICFLMGRILSRQ